jgi:hypothetical protein
MHFCIFATPIEHGNSIPTIFTPRLSNVILQQLMAMTEEIKFGEYPHVSLTNDDNLKQTLRYPSQYVCGFLLMRFF